MIRFNLEEYSHETDFYIHFFLKFKKKKKKKSASVHAGTASKDQE